MVRLSPEGIFRNFRIASSSVLLAKIFSLWNKNSAFRDLVR